MIMPRKKDELPQEVEYKYQSLANVQMKYLPIDKPASFTRKLGCLCGMLNIACGSAEGISIEDQYYDDEGSRGLKKLIRPWEITSRYERLLQTRAQRTGKCFH
jgi:hypothetical protein